MTRAFSKIWILVIVIIVVFLGSGILLAKSSVLKIPVFSEIFYKKRISDLGIQSSPEAALNLEQKLFKGLAPLMRPAGWVIHEIEVTDVGLTSWVNLICSEIKPLKSEPLPLKSEPLPKAVPPEVSISCPFENFQIKFKDGKYITSAHIFEPIEGDVTIFGKVFREDETTINLEFEKVYLGNIPLPKYISKEIEEKIELEINHPLSKNLTTLRIDSIEILDGKAAFKGEIEYGLGFKPKFCTKNEDCGIDTCQQGMDKCVEIKYICENGMCIFPAKTIEFPSPPYKCQEGKCKAEEVIAGETADWKTYRNEEYGFEVRYPASWLIKEFISNPNQVFGIVFYEKEGLEKSVDVQIFTYTDTIEDFIRRAEEITSVKKWSINDYLAVLLGPEGAMGGSLRIFKNGYMFAISCHYTALEIFNQMLSTFRFLE